MDEKTKDFYKSGSKNPDTDLLDKLTEWLNHPLITAAGLCLPPPGIGTGDPGDIDIFVYCTEIPPIQERRGLIPVADYKAGEIGSHWGICDLFFIDGEEIWLMYVTEEETQNETESILSGNMPDRLDNYYYPSGRLSTIKNLNVFFDRNGFIGRLKEKVSVYPEPLAQKLISFHAEVLSDTEDIERAAKRGDVLFYHFALDLALDHFLQYLFALNRVYFPSRKKSMDYICSFYAKPDNCGQVLKDIIRLGTEAKSLGQSLELMKELIEWALAMAL